MVREKRPDLAEPFLNRALALKPTAPGERRELAGVLAAAGRSDRALQLLSSADATPEDYLQLAYLMSGRKDFRAAEKAARTFLQSHPDNPRGQELLANVLSWKGSYPEALKLFEQLAQTYPKNTDYPVRIAEVTLWSGDYSRAATDFFALLKAGSEDPKVRSGFAAAVAALPNVPPQYLPKIESLAAAMTAADAAADPLTAGRLAVSLVRAKRTATAKELGDHLRDVTPTDPVARRELAGILGLLGQRQRALELFAGLELSPEDRFNLAGLYASADDWSAAESEYRSILKDTPDDPRALRQLAELLSWKKDYAASIDLSKKLLQRNPNDTELKTRLAEVQLWSGDYAAAAANFNTLLSQEKSDFTIIASFTAAVANMDPVNPGFEKAAIALAKLAVARDAKDARFLSNMAWVLHRAGDETQATQYLDAALATKPSDPETRKNLAGVLEVMGRTKEALAMFEGLTLTEGDRFRLAGLFSADKQYDQAEIQCRAILEQSPTNQKARRLLADVLSWNGKYDESLALFEELRKESPNQPELPIRIAEVTLWKRDYPTASRLFEQLLVDKFNRPNLWPSFIDAIASNRRITEEQEVMAKRIEEQTRTAGGNLIAKMYPGQAQPTQLPAVFLSRLAWVMFISGDRAAANELVERVLKRSMIEPVARREIAGVLSSLGRYREAIAMLVTATQDTIHRIGYCWQNCTLPITIFRRRSGSFVH